MPAATRRSSVLFDRRHFELMRHAVANFGLGSVETSTGGEEARIYEPVFTEIRGLLVFAAALGWKATRTGTVSSARDDRREIKVKPTLEEEPGFHDLKLGISLLEAMDESDDEDLQALTFIDAIDNDQEAEMLRRFESFAAGGLDILKEELDKRMQREDYDRSMLIRMFSDVLLTQLESDDVQLIDLALGG